MAILIISLLALGVIAAIIGLLSHNKNSDSDVINVGTDCTTCNGDNALCEQECMMVAATCDIEYFDDEELDVFKGRQSDSYTDDEVEQFREVMYTMRQSEVKDWNRSLILRGVAVPDQLKDELVMLMV
ncbi:MAG: hypothetical protein J6Z18_07700 [Prevotella sp.]|nr:hypothetical protein [Prevotella sp.]